MIDEEEVQSKRNSPEEEINTILVKLGKNPYKIKSSKHAAEISVIGQIEKMSAKDEFTKYEREHILVKGEAPLEEDLPGNIREQLKRYRLAKKLLKILDINFPAKWLRK